MILCILITKQNVRYKKTASMPPDNSTGNRTTRKENNATANVAPNTATALNETNRNEPDTKARNTRNGRKPRTTKMNRNKEIKGWFSVNFLACLSVYIA